MGDHRDSSTGPEQSAKYHHSAHSGKGGKSTRSQIKPQWRGKEGGGPSERPWKRYSRTVGRLERGWVEGRSSHQRQGLPHRGASQERQQEEKLPGTTPPKPQLKEGKKKASQSLNHLLNFTIASSSGSPGWGGHLSLRAHKHRPLHHFSKEQFLQANCQFVVRAGSDYSLHLTDPDTLVDWEQVEQVRLFCNEMPSCPICLDQPRVAKITHCGHVFCWSCMLHYLALSDHSWRKCPICFESVHRDSLKSVVALSSPVYHVGDTVVMRLMVRTKWRKEKRAKKRREDQARGHGQRTAHQPAESRNGHHEWLGASPVEVSPNKSHDLLSVDSSPPLPSSAAARDSASVTSPQPQPHQLEEGGPREAAVHTPPLSSVSFAAALRCPNKAAPPPMWPGRESAKKKVPSPTAPKADGDEEGEGEGPMVPSFQDAFGDALATALEKLQPVPTAGQMPVEGPSRVGKKGRKKTVLFTTGNMRRGT